MMPRALTRICIAALLGALGACAIQGTALKQPVVLPANWMEPGVADAKAPDVTWWREFGSAELSRLITAALAASPDLAIARERVLQAEAQARIAGARLFPVLNLSAGTGRRESRPDGESWSGDNSSNVSLSASYEIDLWGGAAASVRGAEAQLRATRFDQETVRLTLVAGVANGYFQLVSLRGRLIIARANLDIANRVFKLVDARVRNGAASGLDLSRQQAAVLGVRAGIVPLELQERQTLLALAILTGSIPQGFQTVGSSVTDISVPVVNPGLPSDLLTRRPDLASAEAQLAAANANITVARAALLPGISLSGSAGLASEALVNVLRSPTATWSLGAALLQPIFSGGRLRAQVAVATSRERELVESYRRAILAALADTDSTLAAASRTADQETLQTQIVEQARKSLRLAEIRYREGADDLLVVLDAQRSLFQAEDQLAQLRLARLQAAVSLFKALGGGWR